MSWGISNETLNIIAYFLLVLESFLANFFIRSELCHILRLGIFILPISPYHNEFFYFIETVRPFIFGIAILFLITIIALLIFAFSPRTNFFEDLTKEKSTSSLVAMGIAFILVVCTTLVSVFILGGGATGALIIGAILSFPVLFVLSVVFCKKIIKFKFF